MPVADLLAYKKTFTLPAKSEKTDAARCVIISSDGKWEYPLPLLLRLWVRIVDESILAFAKVDRLSAPYAVQYRVFDVRFPPTLATGHHENSEPD